MPLKKGSSQKAWTGGYASASATPAATATRQRFRMGKKYRPTPEMAGVA